MKSPTGLSFLLELTIISFVVLGNDVSSTTQEPSNQIKTIMEILKKTKRGGIFGASANANVVSILSTTMRMFEIDDEKLKELHYKAGVTFNEQDADGKSLLFHAFDAKWSVKAIKKMVELGADLHHRDKQGRNLLVYCFYSGASLVLVEYLISEGVSPLQSDGKGSSFLSLAAKLRNRALIEILIVYGIDPNAKDDGGFNLLQHLAVVAAGQDHKDMKEVPALMEYLIRKGADPRFVTNPSSQNLSLLHVTTRYGSLEMMEVLLRNGASPNAQDADGYNTLFFVNPVKGLNRKESIWEKINLLMDYGADVGMRSEMGEVPTQYLELILKGAKTAAEGMMESQEKEKKKEKAKPKENQFKEVDIDQKFMCNEALKESQDFFRSVLDAGFDINQSDIEGQTLLFCLIQKMRIYHNFEKRLTSAIKAVVDKGVEINHVDDWGNSCLHFAAIHGTPEVMRILLEKGVAVNKQDIDGNTALHVIQPFKGQGKQSLLDKVEILMKFGPRTDIKNYFGKVAKDILEVELMNDGPSWADRKEMEIWQRVWNEVQEEAKAKQSHGGEL